MLAKIERQFAKNASQKIKENQASFVSCTYLLFT